MSCRVDTSPLISGACVVGDTGHGVLGSEVPSTGAHGAGYLYNDLSLPADADKEVRGLITTPATGLTTFFAFEDSSFTATGPDGSYFFDYRLYVDGVASVTDIGYGAGIARCSFGIGAGATDLIIADALHSHTADNLGLTSATALAIAEALHAHAADNLALTSATALTVADALHAHASDAPTLTTQSALAIAEALHAHSADAPALTTQSALAIAEALHAHAADNVTLAPTGSTSLTVADALHAHAADNLELTSQLALVIQEALHAHAADGLTLTTASQLAIAEALHAHAADNLTLSDAPFLLIADALHAHTADGVTLTVDAWLVVADALHGHTADNVVLFVPGGAVYPDPATVLAGIVYGPNSADYTGTLVAGLTTAQALRLLDIWQRLGLDPANPQTTTATSIVAGGVDQTISETAGPTITVTRNP